MTKSLPSADQRPLDFRIIRRLKMARPHANHAANGLRLAPRQEYIRKRTRVLSGAMGR